MYLKKLSKTLGVLSLSLLFAGSAFALPILDGWKLDVTSLTGDSYDNIKRISVGGASLVEQDLTGDGGTYYFIQENDSFSEVTILQQLSYFPSSGPKINMENLWFYGTSIEGIAVNVDNAGGSPNPANWQYDYLFTGAGSLGAYYYEPQPGDDFNNDPASFGTVGATQIASFSIVDGSGTVPEAFLGGGNNFTGSTSLRLKFETVMPGVWIHPNTTDFEDYLGLVFANVTLTNFIFSPNDVSIAGDKLTALINHEGSFTVAAVPEPTTMLLLGAGLLGLAAVGRRKFTT